MEFGKATVLPARVWLKLPVLIAIVNCLAFATGAMAASNAPEYYLELRTYENRVDGCTDCGCRLVADLDAGNSSDFWITFGLVTQGEDKSLQADSTYSYCGTGKFESADADFRATIGQPFLIVDLEIQATGKRKGSLAASTILRQKELADFDPQGRPEYVESTNGRTISSKSGEEAVMPLLSSAAAAQMNFGVHEVLLGLSVFSGPNPGKNKFGRLKISSDVPGAAVYLDGGMAGRIGADHSLELLNIAEGRHEVSVSDFSGRQESETIRVKAGKVAETDIQLLDISGSRADNHIAGIGVNPQGFEEFWRFRDQAVMVHIPAGPFLMGSPEGTGDEDEHPQREIDLQNYLIDKHEISVRQFEIYADAEHIAFPPTPVWGKHDNFPVSFVLWDEAEAFCKWVGGRLPSEAEWEKAARGDQGNIYPWGDTWDATRCNSIAGGMHRPESVGSYPRCISPFGVLDMAGSVQEWTQDWYAMYLTPDEPIATDSSVTPKLKVMRGGAWMSQPAVLRTAARHKRSPTSPNMDHGFRCAYDVGEKSK